MSLITFFSAPKPFTDPHIAIIQRNAIKSWTQLPNVEVFLMGKDDGLVEESQELGVRYMSNVTYNINGTPLISSMFQLARDNSKSALLCIINTDMILIPDFLEAVKQAAKLKEKFVLLSQRWDLDVSQPIEFTKGWEEDLRSTVFDHGNLHRPAGSDFFLFPKSCYTNIPDFAIGRAGWDNWMIYKAHQEKWPVIDCTPSVMIVHQNHDYHHLPDGKSHYSHPETDENVRLAGGQAAVRYTILDATVQLKNGILALPVPSWGRFWRRVEIFLRKLFYFLPENILEKVVRPKRWVKMAKRLFK